MGDLTRMRLGVLRQIKNVHKFLDMMEKSVRNHNTEAIQRAYIFLSHMVYMMDKGCLTPNSIALDVELAKVLQYEE